MYFSKEGKNKTAFRAEQIIYGHKPVYHLVLAHEQTILKTVCVLF